MSSVSQSPPPMELLRAPRPPMGAASVRVALDDLALVLTGLDDHVAGRLAERFGTFATSPADGDGLMIAVADAGVEYFIPPPGRPAMNPVLLACDGEQVRYAGYRAAGWFDTGPGRGGLLLASGTIEPPERAIENYVRAAVAWQAASRGGALVHAASAVWRDRGYLFFGESGAGKSTLSASNRRARVVSDDLSLVLPAADGGLDLVGTPFRGTYEEGEAVPGRFALAAGFRIVKDTRAAVRQASRVLLLAGLVGNLPFVADSLGVRDDLFTAIERSFASLPLAYLHFRKDDSYWDAIDRAGLAD
jgi:hypothetical protein